MEGIDTNDNNILTIKTVQIQPFRTLITALKDILIETNIEFSKKVLKYVAWTKHILF